MLETMGSRWPNASRTRLAACKTLASFPSLGCAARLDAFNSLAVHLLYRFHNLSGGA